MEKKRYGITSQGVDDEGKEREREREALHEISLTFSLPEGEKENVREMLRNVTKCYEILGKYHGEKPREKAGIYWREREREERKGREKEGEEERREKKKKFRFRLSSV